MTLQVGGEICTGNRSGAEAVQVLRRHLAVDEYEAPGLELFDQGDKTDLRSVVGATEHGFAEKQPAHRQAV
ncbi:hypothetical protein D3C78_1981470 [compost metagenome]